MTYHLAKWRICFPWTWTNPGNERRLQILACSSSRARTFRHRSTATSSRWGLRLFIAQKLGSASHRSEHLKILSRAGLVRAKRIKQWTFYKRDEKRIAAAKRAFRSLVDQGKGPG